MPSMFDKIKKGMWKSHYSKMLNEYGSFDKIPPNVYKTYMRHDKPKSAPSFSKKWMDKMSERGPD